MTTLDRRTFLARAAAAGGGLMSMGALERLVAREARGNPRPQGSESDRQSGRPPNAGGGGS